MLHELTCASASTFLAVSLGLLALAAGPSERTPRKFGEGTSKAHRTLKVKTKPGCYYVLGLANPDGVPVGTRWQGGKLTPSHSSDSNLAQKERKTLSLNPLEPMYRKRFIIKADDLATWSLQAFQRFARCIEAHEAKAGFGIIPSACGPDVFAWVKTLDLNRFEIWNHTWSHGKDGPNHYGQAYDVQWRNLVMAHETVRKETGITMHTWCGGGIQYQGRGVHDQDDVTHWVIRNHPDYQVHFHADPKFADRGLGNINSDGIFMPWRHSWFENEWLNEKDSPDFVAQLRKRWPDINWNRPNALGNAEEMQWRFDHPFWHVPDSGQVEITVGQFHPISWDEGRLKALGELLEYVKSKGDWRFANAYETYQWLKDRDDIAIEKISPGQYRLDTKSTRFEHELELLLPSDTRVTEHIYAIGSFKHR